MEYVMLADYGPLANPLARQAINLLFPSDQFVSSVMKGTLDAPNSVLPDLMLYAAPGTYKPTAGRGQGQGPAAAGRGQAGHPAHLRVLHRPPQGAGAGAPEPAAADRAEAEPGREGLPGVRRRHLHRQAGVAAARHGVVVLVARVQQPVGLLLPDPVRGRDAEAEPVQRRLLRQQHGEQRDQQGVHRVGPGEADGHVAPGADGHGEPETRRGSRSGRSSTRATCGRT